MSVKALLDDAAAEATAGLTVDLAGARQRSTDRRAQLRRRASAAIGSAAALAAVVAMIAVLLPGNGFRSAGPPPATSVSGPAGLPDRWYYAPPWTPPVTRHPMPAASMVLSALLAVEGGAVVDGPVLVSADGSGYAALPWTRYSAQVALAPDGRDVAWVTQADSAGNGPDRNTVHRIHLEDGEQSDVQLEAGLRVDQLVWAKGELFVAARVADTGATRIWSLDAEASDPIVCDDDPLPLGVDAAGGLVQLSTDGPELPGIGRVASSSAPDEIQEQSGYADVPEDARIVSPSAVVDPTGTRAAGIVVVADPSGKTEPRFQLRIIGGPADRVTPIAASIGEITQAQVLAWTEGGIVVRVHSQDDANLGHRAMSLRLYPVTGEGAGASRVISRPSGTRAYPVAVAAEVAGAGVTLPGVQPEYAEYDRAHLSFLLGQDRYQYLWALALVGAGLLAALVVTAVRFRRRRPAASSGPG